MRIGGGGGDERRPGFFGIDRPARMKKPLATNISRELYLTPKTRPPNFFRGRGINLSSRITLIYFAMSTHCIHPVYWLVHCMSGVRSATNCIDASVYHALAW